MRKWSAKLLTLLCAVALLVAMVPMGILPTSAGKILKHRSETTLLEEIIERDGFFEGIWYPWFTHTYLGCGLTTNEMAQQYLKGWSGATNCWYDFSKVGIDEYGADKIYQEIYNLKAMGYNILGYEGSIYSEGVIFDDTGDVIGIKDEYLYNVRRLLDMCRDIGMPVLWTITCHSSSVCHYYTNGKNFWDRACRYYADKTVADHYAERFVRPLAAVLAEYPDVVALVASTSEAENELNDSQVGNTFEGNRAHYGVDQEHMVYFVNAVTEAVKKEFPEVPRTICCQLSDMSMYSEVDFDILGDQNYNWAGRADVIEEFRPTVPMFGSEYGWGDDVTCTDAELTDFMITFRSNFRKQGYKGCIMWCWSPDATKGSAYDLLKKGAKNVTDYRSTVYDLYYFITEQRDIYRGDKTVLDTPAVLCNTGNGLIEWIAPRQATKIDILRSDDGGKTWVTEVKNDKASRYVTNNKGQYVSETTPTANTVYKIVVRDDKGNERSSEVTNKASDRQKFSQKYTGSKEDNKTYNLGNFPFNLNKVGGVSNPLVLATVGVDQNRPATADVNLLKDGSFETSMGGFSSASALKVISDSTAPEGGKSLFFDTSKQSTAEWHIFWVDVEKNTDYVFSTWIKGEYLSTTNQGYATIGVVDSATNRYVPYTSKLPFYTQCQQIVPTGWDNSWHLRSVTFNSGSRTKVGIALYGCSSKMYVDGMALFKNGNGLKYASSNMTQIISTRFDVEYTYCADKNNLFQNATMDKSSSYWSTGSGWKGGFLSIADNKYEYGKSMKYTASSNPVGQHYLQWVDVEPNTWYTFSVDMKILKSGNGRVILLDGKMRNPAEIISVQFDGDSFGDDWFCTNFRLNTGTHTRIAFGVVDGGGSALIDNVRLFKTANGIEGDDTYKDQTGGTVTAPTATVKPSTAKPTGTTVADGTTSATTPVEGDPTDATSTTAPTEEGDVTAPTDAVDEGDNTDEDIQDTDSPTDDAEGFPWLIVGIAGGAVLLIAAGVVVFLILRKKKA